MRNTLRILAAGALTTGLLGTAASAKENKSTVTQATDKAVKAAREDVNESILNSKIRMAMLKSLKGADALRVNMTVSGTSVTLSGEVEDRASEKLASEVAKSVAGVTEVRSTITHNPNAPHQDNLEAKVKDAMLESEVRLRLLQEVGASGAGLHVTATDGVVSLRGQMPNNTTRAKAVEKVKAMPNVQRVEDLMSTTP